jgi:ABC-type histidine transport system ATPase subunit
VLLLDEPTSALDPERANEALEVIRRLAADDDLAMIISTISCCLPPTSRIVRSFFRAVKCRERTGPDGQVCANPPYLPGEARPIWPRPMQSD